MIRVVSIVQVDLWHPLCCVSDEYLDNEKHLNSLQKFSLDSDSLLVINIVFKSNAMITNVFRFIWPQGVFLSTISLCTWIKSKAKISKQHENVGMLDMTAERSFSIYLHSCYRRFSFSTEFTVTASICHCASGSIVSWFVRFSQSVTTKRTSKQWCTSMCHALREPAAHMQHIWTSCAYSKLIYHACNTNIWCCH